MRYATLRSTSSFVPERELTNDMLRARFAERAPGVIDKLEAATGITTRFRMPDDWATSDLALRAARAAIDGVCDASDLDLVVVATDSPDFVTPATSVVLQHKLGATRAGTFDVGCACASFPTAVASAAGLLATGCAKNALVVGAYAMSKLADPDDPISFFYGDGAGAVLLEASDAPGFLGAAFRADGSFATRWHIASGGTAEPASEASVRAGRTRVRLREPYPPEVNDDGWPLLVRRLADANGFAVRDIDLLVMTQVRRQTIERVMQRLELPLDRAPITMDRWGYTGSACIPMALHHARPRPGQLVVMVGSGVGYNQAAVAMRTR